MRTFVIGTHLDAPAEEVWQRVTTIEAVNDELRPMMRMTCPDDVRRLEIGEVRLGTRLCRSWLLLLGVLPIGFDDITLVVLEEGRFVEDSAVTSLRTWRHERTVAAVSEEGCVLTDRLTYEPRLRVLGGPLGLLVPILFRHRHRRLRRRFDGPPRQPRAM